jgi:hypothetical protein
LNVTVPSNAPVGDDPLIATYSGFTTQSGTLLAIQ